MTLDPAKSQSILLADDDCMIFTDALKELSNDNQLIIANDGVELMRTLDDLVPPRPYVIFLDLNLPRKNGFDCLKANKQNTKLKDIPIVILSTTCTTDVVDRTYHAGANYYVCKHNSFPLLIKAPENVFSLDMNQLLKQPERDQFLLLD